MSEPTETGVDHVVLLKIRDEATPAQLQQLDDGINSLRVIPGVVDITVGPTFVEEWMDDRRLGYNYALRVRLSSKEALRSYQDHDLHVKAKKGCIAPIIARPPLAVDWESPLVVGKISSGAEIKCVDHVVLLKLHDETSTEKLQRLTDETHSLLAISGVVSITIGPTFVEEWMDDRRQGYSYALRVRLSTKEALHLYQDSDLHEKVKRECIAPILSGPPLAVDWESPLVIGEKQSSC